MELPSSPDKYVGQLVVYSLTDGEITFGLVTHKLNEYEYKILWYDNQSVSTWLKSSVEHGCIVGDENKAVISSEYKTIKEIISMLRRP